MVAGEGTPQELSPLKSARDSPIMTAKMQEPTIGTVSPVSRDVLTGPLLALALLVIGSIVIKAIRDRARGTNGKRNSSG